MTDDDYIPPEYDPSADITLEEAQRIVGNAKMEKPLIPTPRRRPAPKDPPHKPLRPTAYFKWESYWRVNSGLYVPCVTRSKEFARLREIANNPWMGLDTGTFLDMVTKALDDLLIYIESIDTYKEFETHEERYKFEMARLDLREYHLPSYEIEYTDELFY